MNSQPIMERALRDGLRQMLDLETGRYPVWADSPAARMAQRTRPRQAGAKLRMLALAAVLVLGTGATLWYAGFGAPGLTTSDSAPVPSVTFGVVNFGDCPAVVLTEGYRPGVPLAAPYVVHLRPSITPLRGPVPSPLDLQLPAAQIDFRGDESWAPTGAQAGRPGIRIEGPTSGFGTAMLVGGFQGSFVFDSPGLWRATINGPAAGCQQQFLVEVQP